MLKNFTYISVESAPKIFLDMNFEETRAEQNKKIQQRLENRIKNRKSGFQKKILPEKSLLVDNFLNQNNNYYEKAILQKPFRLDINDDSDFKTKENYKKHLKMMEFQKNLPKLEIFFLEPAKWNKKSKYFFKILSKIKDFFCNK